MANKIALLTIHGMGTTKEDYFQDLLRDLIPLVGRDLWSNRVHFESIYYQDILQDPQLEYFNAIESKVGSNRLGNFFATKLRKFLLYGFSDAGGLEFSRTINDSAYELVQWRIFDALGRAFDAVESLQSPVVVVAQSLGGQVLSNYIWDAQHASSANYGVWRHDHSGLGADNVEFRQLRSLRVLMTTGCNIPIFIGGLPRALRKPIRRPNEHFVWENYYDEDDPLGWPLQELNRDFDVLVTDIEVNIGNLLTAWNPLSHTKYWTDSDVQRPLAEHLKSLLN